MATGCGPFQRRGTEAPRTQGQQHPLPRTVSYTPRSASTQLSTSFGHPRAHGTHVDPTPWASGPLTSRMRPNRPKLSAGLASGSTFSRFCFFFRFSFLLSLALRFLSLSLPFFLLCLCLRCGHAGWVWVGGLGGQEASALALLALVVGVEGEVVKRSGGRSAEHWGIEVMCPPWAAQREGEFRQAHGSK